MAAAVRFVPVSSVRLLDGFWAPRIAINRWATIPSQFRLLEETGRLERFRRAARGEPAASGLVFDDSDVYKWIEAAARALESEPDEGIERDLAEAVRTVAAAQDRDGYLNTAFAGERAAARWTNLKDDHELYCAGHLFEAAVAHRRATGLRVLLDVAIRFADLLCATFGPAAEGKREAACGHPEAELALVELFRATGERRYLDLARFMVEVRGRGRIGGSVYHQDHAPLAQLDAPVGHAVRMMYLCCGAADLELEGAGGGWRPALERIWERMTSRRMYLTGGIGARWGDESFGDDDELPDRAYAETCAAIGSVRWSLRMLALTGEAKYADLVERQLLNAVLPGLSLDGKNYFYQNPLADDGSHRRRPWFECACCPPNVARTLAELPAFYYGVSRGAVWVHQYGTSSARLEVPGAGEVVLAQYANWPWEGDVRIEVLAGGGFELRIRVPAWARSAVIRINGEAAGVAAEPGTYASIHRTWRRGDEVAAAFGMEPEATASGGRVAFRRGPVVYCVEAADLDGADPRTLAPVAGAPVSARYRPDLLGGVIALNVAAAGGRPVMAVPYYAWANRSAGPMTVWLGGIA